MKKSLFFALSLGALMLISSCRRENDNGQLSGLAAFLNGRFEVTQADYNGNLSTVLGQTPLSGTGENTEGFYNFQAANGKVNYEVNSTMNLQIFGQNIPFPIEVLGTGDITYVSETRFTIDDPRYGLMTYDVNDRTNNSLVASTRYQTDTLSATIDLTLDIYLSKQ